jgi:hypothetical protein
MAYKTKLQVVQKIERELDLEEEVFIQDEEMNDYINDAITLIEAKMNTLGFRDQYYLTRSTISLVTGQADYALPTNLYEGKIKEVVYSVGATIYKVEPMQNSASAEAIEHLNRFSTNEFYKYRIRSDAANANYFQLIPKSRETAANAIVIEYYRDLQRVSSDNDLVEVPEIALQFLYQYVKVKVLEKEGHALLGQAKADLEAIEEEMVSTLSGQLVDDSQNLLELDKQIYEEFS